MAKKCVEYGSLTTLEHLENDRKFQAARNYSYKAPWNEKSIDDIEAFERSLQALDYKYETPWSPDDGGETTYTNVSYKYESLWAKTKLPPNKIQQIQDYKYRTPYGNESDINTSKQEKCFKLNGSTTIPPWQQGSQSRASTSNPHIIPKPKTSLWDTPDLDIKADMNSACSDPILDNLRQQLRCHGASGICGLSRKFRIMDDDNSGYLSQEEFEKAMRECELVDLSAKAVAHLFRFFDTDDSGTISYDEFLVGIRGSLNQRRKSIVHLAFQKLDADMSGVITVEDLLGVYDASKHHDVIAGKKTETDILHEFLAQFIVKEPRKRSVSIDNNKVTLNDFENYYANISASIDDDDYFELMIRNAWRLTTGYDSCLGDNSCDSSSRSSFKLTSQTRPSKSFATDHLNKPHRNSTGLRISSNRLEANSLLRHLTTGDDSGGKR